MTITDTFNVPDIPAVIAKWPPDGLGLVQARQRMPRYGRKVPVGRAIQARGSQVAFEYVQRIMFQACEGELRQMLGSRMLVLVGLKIEEPNKPIEVPPSMIPLLQFDFDRVDRNTVRFDNGMVLDGCTIYSKTHWLARSKDPLLIKYDGTPPPLLILMEQPTAEAPAEEKESQSEAEAPAAFQSTVRWLEWAVKEYLPADWKWGWQKRYSEKLEPLLAEAAKKNLKLTASDAPSIYTRLSQHNLWPEPPKQ